MTEYNAWKCDYCSETNRDKEKMKIHEKHCSSNIENKMCFMCSHYQEMGYPISGSDMRCMNKNSVMYDKNVSYQLDEYQEKYKNPFFPCEDFEKENI